MPSSPHRRGSRHDREPVESPTRLPVVTPTARVGVRQVNGHGDDQNPLGLGHLHHGSAGPRSNPRRDRRGAGTPPTSGTSGTLRNDRAARRPQLTTGATLPGLHRHPPRAQKHPVASR